MADQPTRTDSADGRADEPVVHTPASNEGAQTADVTPKLTDPSAADNALVGDEAVYEHVREVEPEVVQEDVPAQLPPEPSKAAETVPVNEVYVALDEVILDPSSPLAVQIPDAGRGGLDLPIHVLARGTYDQQVESGAAAEVKPADADE